MKKGIIISIFVSLFFTFNIFSQNKSGNVWVTGNGAILITFNDTSKPVTSQIFQNFSGGIFDVASSVICDSVTGALLAMCNGYVLFDSAGNIMEGGDSLVPSKVFHHNAYPMGIATQGSIILPKGSGGLYYVITPSLSDSAYTFYVTNQGGVGGKVPFDLLQYHIIDMNANTGLGKVIQKDIPLLTNVEMAKVGMMACRHANGYDWWLLKQALDTNMIYTFLITNDTIEFKYLQGFAEPHFGYSDLVGQSCFSSDGSKYAFATGGSNSGMGAQLGIADFDRCTGLLSNMKSINVPIDSTGYWYWDSIGIRDSLILGLCFSPNDSFLYINKFMHTYQYEYNIPDSIQAWYEVHRYDTVAEYALFGQMQKGIDNRIYIGKYSGYQLFNNVINKPNIKGAGCDFCQFCLDFSAFNGASTSPPNMPDFNLGPLLPCWPLENSQLAVGCKQLEVYPNPSSTIFYIKNVNGKKKELYNVLGELLFSTKADEINVKYFAKGMYYIRCENESKKVIIE
ncbi:MAG: T9SS type A sorting domain-containing protein [Bacteroidetes bacterium]|nr:T9SS type A sorting domain-containing protein [Bacteroidota bacterium]